MVEQKRPKANVDPKDFEWLVHIDEGFEVQVKSPNPEGALMLGFAKYYLEHPDPSMFAFKIELVNLTLYNRAVRKK